MVKEEEEKAEKCTNFSHNQEESFSHSSGKGRKTKTLIVDRISSLPDGIIVDILSLLPTTEEAIRTGTLSKRWQYLWTFVSTLSFYNNRRPTSDFVSFVNKTLAQCRNSKLKKFELLMDYDPSLESQLNQWISYAVGCDVEELEFWDINLWQHKFKLPDHLFSSSFFSNLVLRSCVFEPNGPITWKMLKRLSISRASLNEDTIGNILGGSPVLEILELGHCYGFNRLDITSKSVRVLVLCGYSDPDEDYGSDKVVEIYAPHILSLDIKGVLFLWKLLVRDISSTVEANLDYNQTVQYVIAHEERKEEMLIGLLQSLHHVNQLTLGTSCSKVLSRLEHKGFRFPPVGRVERT